MVEIHVLKDKEKKKKVKEFERDTFSSGIKTFYVFSCCQHNKHIRKTLCPSDFMDLGSTL